MDEIEHTNEEEKSAPAPSNQEQPGPYMVPASIIVAGALIAGAVVYSNLSPGASGGGQREGGAAVAGGSPPSVPVRVENLEDDDPVLGNPKARVTIVEFGDFQCPFCGRFFKTTEQQVVEKYVKTGKVKFVYRDFAFLGSESEWAAQGAECAKEQGKFWPFHDYLYNHQQGENQGAFSKENLKRFARELNLDGTRFDACLDSEKHLEEVRKDTADGRAAGVSGTPSSFINGKPVVGAVPFEQFAAAIEEELKQAK